MPHSKQLVKCGERAPRLSAKGITGSLLGKVLAAASLVALFVLTSCAAPAHQEDVEVLGVSVVTTSIGTTRVSVLGSDVNIQMLDAESSSTIALARDGEIVVTTEIEPGNEADLTVDEPGTYDILGIELGEAGSNGDVSLARPQQITKLGTAFARSSCCARIRDALAAAACQRLRPEAETYVTAQNGKNPDPAGRP